MFSAHLNPVTSKFEYYEDDKKIAESDDIEDILEWVSNAYLMGLIYGKRAEKAYPGSDLREKIIAEYKELSDALQSS